MRMIEKYCDNLEQAREAFCNFEGTNEEVMERAWELASAAEQLISVLELRYER